MTIFDIIPSAVVPLATVLLTFGSLALSAALHGGVEVDSIDAHEALVEIARVRR